MSVKKISIVRTNNSPFFATDGRWVIGQQLNASHLQLLKDYVTASGFSPPNDSELQIVLSALKWVHSQWEHDGMNQPPAQYRALDILKSVHEQNQKYRCVEYGIVLSEMLQAYGFITRTIGLRTSEVAYGGFGQGHVAMEVWLNEFNKWIFLDPQFGIYLTANEAQIPLNFYESYQQKREGKWNSILAHSTSVKADKNYSNEYKDFLRNYFGHMKVSSGLEQPNICLLLEAIDFPITFQGIPSNDMVFTKDSSLVYPEMNKTTLLLSYKEDDPQEFQNRMMGLNITSNEEYLKNMPLFAAKPIFLVKLLSSTSNIKGYEYRRDHTGPWIEVKNSEFSWDAVNTNNFLEVRLITGFGHRGPTTFVEIDYR